MSIAILPMSKEFNWNSATVGLIQSSFFWGYLLTQVWYYLKMHLTFYSLFSYKCITEQVVKFLQVTFMVLRDEILSI